MNIIKRRIPIYDVGIAICLLTEQETFEDLADKLKIGLRSTDNAIAGVFEVPNDMTIYIYLYPDADVYVIAHECVHIISIIFKRLGIFYNADNDKPYAYLMSHLCDRIDKIRIEYQPDGKDESP